jgi:hypothetical protein
MSRVLFIQADSRTLNPRLDEATIDAEYAADPAVARAEWGGLFRDDVSGYLTDELIDAALPGRLVHGRRRRPVAFVDTSGGVIDASVLAIAHAEDISEPGERRPPIVVLDHLQYVAAPHQPARAVEDFVKTLKDFGLAKVTGDRYAGNWCADAFSKLGIRYEPSELDKSGLYNEAAALFAGRRVELLDDRRLFAELRMLERRPRSGGRADSIDHPPRGHDDAVNACCGALWLAAARREGIRISDAQLRAHSRPMPGSPNWQRLYGDSRSDGSERTPVPSMLIGRLRS